MNEGNVFQRLSSLFRRRTVGPVPQREFQPGDLGTPQGDAERKMIPAEGVRGFIGGDLTFVSSSNVAAAQYFAADQKLMIEFLSGAAYLYSDISEQEALLFANSPSKGAYIWDILRVRGSSTASRKPYVRIR